MLKKELARLGVEFETLDMSLPQNLVELRINGCFSRSAPVMMVGDDIYEIDDLFDKDNLNGDNLNDIKTLINNKPGSV
jgi:hypothetical protein